MSNIDKLHIINSNNLSGKSYFTSILQEAYNCGLLYDSDIEDIHLRCLEFLACKSERYNCGRSSSIRVEQAESIMKSIFYTIGLYLKSLPDADSAVSELKTAIITEMYEKGRRLIKTKLHTAKHLYILVQENKLDTINYTYNATVNDEGIGSFFKLYNPEYEAHEIPASIDYQLCNPVNDLAGVEYIQKYLENLLLENEFCSRFNAEDIHHLLCSYDKGYKDLLINIFEHVLTAALGCVLAKRSVLKLDITDKEIQRLSYELSKDNDNTLAVRISKASEKVLEELNVTNISLRTYIEKSLPKITVSIIHAVRINTLGQTFVAPVNLNLKPKIQFLPGEKMDDKKYRKLINELLICRYSSDKLALIKENVKSFSDMEDVLLDAHLSGEEITSLFDILGDVEIAALIKRHPFKSDIQAVDLSEGEQALQLSLKRYFDQLATDRQETILEIVDRLIDD